MTRSLMIVGLAAVLCGCSDDAGSAADASVSADSRTAQDSAQRDNSVPPTDGVVPAPDRGATDSTPPASAWKRVFGEGKATSCPVKDVTALDALTLNGVTIAIGYEQRPQNQNPIVARFEQGKQVWCKVHETQGPDGRAVGLSWDGGAHAYVVYTIVGGDTDLEAAAKAGGGWLSSYAPGAISGGGPKVSFIGRLETQSGDLVGGTFVIAVTSKNKVNGHKPAAAVQVLVDGSVEFRGGSAHKPIDVDGKAMSCTNYPFDSRYRFSADLKAVICADCTNCTADKPCP